MSDVTPNQSEVPPLRRFIFKYVLSCAAATVAETATFPLDTVKTRLQLAGDWSRAASHSGHTVEGPSTNRGTVDVPHSSNKPTTASGMARTFSNIVRHEGFFSLFRGVGPGICRHYVYTGLRICGYEYLRDNVLGRQADGSFPMWKAMIAGVVSGAVGQFCASPTDLIKVQMQMEGLRRVQGLPPRVHGAWHAVSSAVATGGLLALWKGALPNCQRAALVTMADVATYDMVKHWLLDHTPLKDNWVVHACSSACAGLAAALSSTPVDVLKTRIMNQPTDINGRGLLYKGSMDCLRTTVRNEGVLTLWAGFVPIYARMAPWSLTFWVCYEEIRKFTGDSSF